MMALRILGRIALGFVSFWLLVFLIQTVRGFYLPSEFWIAFLSVWSVTLIVLEILSLCNKKPLPRLLTHLRFAPLAITVSFLVIVVVFDAAMVQYSKHKIRAYVYGSMPADQEIYLQLHNTDRGWCGNGRMATRYWLYGATAAEGFSSPDPAVRARALRVSLQVYYPHIMGDDPLTPLIKRAAQDRDPLVRELAINYLEPKELSRTQAVQTPHSDTYTGRGCKSRGSHSIKFPYSTASELEGCEKVAGGR
jgi:hypothetical protein